MTKYQSMKLICFNPDATKNYQQESLPSINRQNKGINRNKNLNQFHENINHQDINFSQQNKIISNLNISIDKYQTISNQSFRKSNRNFIDCKVIHYHDICEYENLIEKNKTKKINDGEDDKSVKLDLFKKAEKEGPAKNKNDDEEEEENTKEVASISSTSSLTTFNRTLLNLKAAINEKFVPKSIKNIRIFVFVIILLLSTIGIVFQIEINMIFDSLYNCIQAQYYSRTRVNPVLNINRSIKRLININDAHNVLSGTNSSLPLLDISNMNVGHEYTKYMSILRSSSIELKDLQANLSNCFKYIQTKNLLIVNPQQVPTYFLPTAAAPSYEEMSLWKGSNEISSQVLIIKDYELNQFNYSDMNVYFIANNTVDKYLSTLLSSSDGFFANAVDSMNSGFIIILYLLIIASSGVLILGVLMIPILYFTKLNKENILKLFFVIKKSSIEILIKKCQTFLNEGRSKLNHSESEEKSMNNDENPNSQ